MCIVNNKFSYIFVSLNEHKRMWVNYSNHSFLSSQFATPLDETSIKVAVKPQRFAIVILNKLFQLRAEVTAISIGWISHHNIV